MPRPYPTRDNPQQFSRHGTRQAYDKGHCRCPECQAWKKVENAKKFKRRKARNKKAQARLYGLEQKRRRGEQVGRSGKLTKAQEEVERLARRRAGEKD